MAPAGTVIWLLSKAMFSALRSMVTDSGSGEGDGVGVGVGSGFGLGVGVGVGLGVATHAVRLVRAIASDTPIKMKLPRRRTFFMSILLIVSRTYCRQNRVRTGTRRGEAVAIFTLNGELAF